MKIKSLIISVLLVFVGLVANAQQHNEQVTVEGSYRPQIKRSERLQKTLKRLKTSLISQITRPRRKISITATIWKWRL